MVLIRKNYHLKKSVSPKNLWIRPCCYTRALTVDLYWTFLKNFQNTVLRTFFLPYIWFALFAFSKNILVHVVASGDLAKFSMQTSATAKRKICSFSNNEFHCCLDVCFQSFMKFEETFRFIYLECFFVWCVFFKWQRKYFYQSALLAISFVYFHFDDLIRIHTH